MARFMHKDAIERVADVVILPDRPEQDEWETPRAGEADLMVLKNRNGPQVGSATVTVAYDARYSRFLDIAPSGFAVNPDTSPKSS